MHKIKRKMGLCILLIGVLICAVGCSAKKDILLERSIAQEEFSKQEMDSSIAEDGQEDSSTVRQEVLSEEAVIYVYICGEVKKPGVYEMHAMDRVYTVIERAGGLTGEADAKAVNQAEALTDGQMIYIPSVEETKDQAPGQFGVNGTDQNDSATGRQTAAGADESGKVNINTANADELMTLPGIGEGKAKNILSYREAHGPFGSVEEIMNVDGIKEGTYAKMKDRITV